MPPLVRGKPHVGCYQKEPTAFEDATALCGGFSCLLLIAHVISPSVPQQARASTGQAGGIL